MRRITPLLLLAAAAVAVAFCGVALAGSVSFTDPSGDAGTAPDVTAVSVSDNPATGVATVSVTTGAQLAVDDTVYVDIDSDKNASTGSGGSDYYLRARRDSSGSTLWDFERWAGKDWSQMPDSKTASFNRNGNVLTWTFSAAEIGGSSAFDFWITSYHHDDAGTVVASDSAPDDGWWSFTFAKSTADTQAPTIHARASHGTVGKPAHLHFTVHDNSGRVSIGYVVYKGSQRLALDSYSLQKLSGDYFVSWTSKKRGTFRFCVLALDAANNKSALSCALVTIS